MPFVRIALFLAGLAAVVVGVAGAQDKPLAFGTPSSSTARATTVNFRHAGYDEQSPFYGFNKR